MTASQGIIGRALSYGKRHGLRATLSRAMVSFKRGWLGTRMVLFECDLHAQNFSRPEDLADAVIERKNGPAEIDPKDLQQITNAWNPRQAARLHAERFARGASLWLLKLDGQVAAFGWTLRRDTMEPHYFPLSDGDAHLFDFFVFPAYRGRRLNPLLVNHILAGLAVEGLSRAFIEAAEWNTAQLSSLNRTCFRKLGLARKFRIFGRTVVVWSQS